MEIKNMQQKKEMADQLKRKVEEINLLINSAKEIGLKVITFTSCMTLNSNISIKIIEEVKF